jgi:hypothetical protein
LSTLTAIVVLGTVLHVVVLGIMIWIRVQRKTDGEGVRGAQPKFTPCAVCGSPAVDWKYDGLDLDEQTDPDTGRVWSFDMSHYRPLCADHSQNPGLPGPGTPAPDPAVCA